MRPNDADTWELYAEAQMRSKFNTVLVVHVQYDPLPRLWDGCVRIDLPEPIISVNRFLWDAKTAEEKRKLIDHEVAHVACGVRGHGAKWEKAYLLLRPGDEAEKVTQLESVQWKKFKQQVKKAQGEMFNSLLAEKKNA